LKLEDKISANEKKVDHLIDITNLHENHVKAVDHKIDDISNQLATMLQVKKFHFAKSQTSLNKHFWLPSLSQRG
jgi:hypothetical protein